MTEKNQKILYDDFMKNAKEGKTDIQRKYCKEAAADILKSFPQFKKPKSETAAEKKAREKTEAAKEE